MSTEIPGTIGGRKLSLLLFFLGTDWMKKQSKTSESDFLFSFDFALTRFDKDLLNILLKSIHVMPLQK